MTRPAAAGPGRSWHAELAWLPGLGITADGKTVVVANWESDSVTAVDVVNGVVLADYDLRPGMIDPAKSGVAGSTGPSRPNSPRL